MECAVWMTSQRLMLASFGPSLYNDEFRLVVQAEDDIDWQSLMLTPFQPFTPAAWTCIVCVVLYMAMALNATEQEPFDEDEVTLLDHLTDLVGVANITHPWLKAADQYTSFVLKSCCKFVYVPSRAGTCTLS